MRLKDLLFVGVICRRRLRSRQFDWRRRRSSINGAFNYSCFFICLSLLDAERTSVVEFLFVGVVSHMKSLGSDGVPVTGFQIDASLNVAAAFYEASVDGGGTGTYGCGSVSGRFWFCHNLGRQFFRDAVLELL